MDLKYLVLDLEMTYLALDLDFTCLVLDHLELTYLALDLDLNLDLEMMVVMLMIEMAQSCHQLAHLEWYDTLSEIYLHL